MKKKLVIGVSVLMASASLPSLALAQVSEAGPPERELLDVNGVDVARGTYSDRRSYLAIGSGRGRLEIDSTGNTSIYESARIRIWTTNSGYTVRVSVGKKSFRFQANGAGFQTSNGDGATLIRQGEIFRLTEASGRSYNFEFIFSPNPEDPSSDRSAYLSKIVEPDGFTTEVHWDVGTYRVCRDGSQDLMFCPDGGGYYSPREFNEIRFLGISNSAKYYLETNYELSTLSVQPDIASWQTPVGMSSYSIESAYDHEPGQIVSIASSQQYASSGFVDYIDEIIDAAGQITQYRRGRNGSSSYLSITAPGSQSEDLRVTSSIGPNGSNVQSIMRNGKTWAYSYTRPTAATSELTVTNPDGTARKYWSNLVVGLPTKIQDEQGGITVYNYDTANRLSSSVSPSGQVVTYGYDGRGNVTSKIITDSAGTATLASSTVYPTGCASGVTCNLPTSITDERGITTTYAYDTTHGGLLSATVQNPTGPSPSSQIRYSQVNGVWMAVRQWQCRTQAACENSADAVQSSATYDLHLRPQTVTQSAGDGMSAAVTTIGYNLLGDVTSVDGPLPGAGDTTRYVYDPARRIVMTVSPDPDGAGARRRAATAVIYNAKGQVTAQMTGSASDPAGADFTENYRATYQYDANHNLRRQTIRSGGVDQAVRDYLYDSAGRPSCQIDHMDASTWGALASSCAPVQIGGSAGPDRVTQTTYDGLGRTRTVTNAVGTAEATTEVITYASNRQLRKVADGKGNETIYDYDTFGRPKRTTYADGSYEQSSYAANGQLNNIRLRDGKTVGLQYDGLGRRRTTVFNNPVDTTDSNLTYSYDLLGRVTSIQDTNGHGVAYAYDALGRITSESGLSGTLTSQYDLAGRRERLTWGDGFFVTYDYDTTGAMTAIRENGAMVLASFGYDDLGRRITRSLGNGTSTSYGYNAISRLTALNLNGGEQPVATSLTYNPAGQIASRTSGNDAYAYGNLVTLDRPYAANALNQYTQSGNVTPTYDGRGNLTSAGGATYLYNSKNQLSGANGTYLYYDAVGRLDQVTQSGLAWQWDGNRLVTEYQGGSVARRYVHGPGVDEPIVQYDGPTLGQRRWLDADERGSIVRVTNDVGGVVAVNSYDEYGIPGANNYGRFQYTGQMWMPELGFYYYKARMYSPTLGRFLQSDPIGYGDGLNMYDYVGGDPVNAVDPSGMKCGWSRGGTVTTEGGTYSGRVWLCDDIGGGSWGGFGRFPQYNPGGGYGFFFGGSGGGGDAPVAPATPQNGCPGGGVAFLAPGAAVAETTVGSVASAAGRALLGVLTLPLLLGGDTPREDPQYVIRGGVTTPESLIRGTTSFSYNGSRMSGFSVTSAPGMSVGQLAAAANYPNGQISYTTTTQLASLGAPVVATPLSNQPLHSTVSAASPLSPAQASAISAQFTQIPNPARCR